jgi:hypothetical protein
MRQAIRLFCHNGSRIDRITVTECNCISAQSALRGMPRKTGI